MKQGAGERDQVGTRTWKRGLRCGEEHGRIEAVMLIEYVYVCTQLDRKP
ncbi:MAG TPA: hypothetical protein IAC37_00765 [Candidatus Ventrimonas merdavium]|nr:hypothetical protein [Candidatus Ventrimonas merdavium]